MLRHLRISLRRSSGEGCVKAVNCWACQSFTLCRDVETAYDSKTAGVADGAGELGVSDPLHPTLHNGYCTMLAMIWTSGCLKITSYPEGPGESSIERHVVAERKDAMYVNTEQMRSGVESLKTGK